MPISVITPVFEHSELTSKFIQAIAPYMEGNELIVVDNNSSDKTLAVLATTKKLFPNLDLTVVSNHKNVGFGTANNIGVRLSKYDNLLFISNDVVILDNAIKLVNDYLTEHPRDSVGPRLIASDTGWNTYENLGTIPYLEGFCFGVNKLYHNMIGGFDENIFIDMEDLDYCYRLRLAGIGLAQIQLPVMHNLGGSFDGLSKARLEYTLTSLHYFEQKYGTKLIRK